jgi:hypothetical protein
MCYRNTFPPYETVLRNKNAPREIREANVIVTKYQFETQGCCRGACLPQAGTACAPSLGFHRIIGPSQGRPPDASTKPLGGFHFLMTCALLAGPAELVHFYLIFFALAPGIRVVLIFAVRTLQNVCNSLSHYAMTSVTTPAPTVWPPSRIANRTPFSKAIGVISSASNSMLSPGITISTPGFKVTLPVMSLVRK